MKRTVLGLLVFLFAAVPAMADEVQNKFGSLNVFSKTGTCDVFVDNEPIGTTPVKIGEIRAGTHFVKAVSGESVLHEDVAEINAGELTTIIVSPIGEPKKAEVRYIEVKKEEPKGPDYSEKMLKGTYLVVGYLTDSYYSSWYSSSYFSLSGSSICYGVGYKHSFAPHMDVALELTRADFSRSGTNWYVMPIGLNLSYSFPTQNRTDKWYMSLGLSSKFTNLSNNGEGLGGIGYSFISGYESPAWNDAVFYEYGYASGAKAGDVSNWMYFVRMGYRWNAGRIAGIKEGEEHES